MNRFDSPREFLFSYDKLSVVFESSFQGRELIEKIKTNMIPVMNSAEELEQFIINHNDYLIVPYLFHKDAEAQLLSTSSMHINWLWPNLLYVPTNIEKHNYSELFRVYQAASNDNVILFNHSFPHKSNPIMQKLFGDEFGDYITRTDRGFCIADGNGQAFIQMATELANEKNYPIDFLDATIVIVGVGGLGTLAAKASKKVNPKRLILVDIIDNSEFAKGLCAEFYQGVDKIPDLDRERLVIIDSTAHAEYRLGDCVSLELVKRYDAKENVFIDSCMYTEIGAYNYLKSITGVGKEYVAFTNYIMLLEIIKAAMPIKVVLPFVNKTDFDRMIEHSVEISDRIKTVLKKL
jgi:hypothetical protein